MSKRDTFFKATVRFVNTFRPRQNGRHFADDTFKRTFFNENVRISITLSLKFVPKSLIDNIPALVPIMAWRRPGDKPLSEPMMVNLPTHICVTRPQWVNNITDATGRTMVLCACLRGTTKPTVLGHRICRRRGKHAVSVGFPTPVDVIGYVDDGSSTPHINASAAGPYIPLLTFSVDIFNCIFVNEKCALR